ncbi:uncharacterized protein [Typha latifolia]|uniref:uncharacterized protein isoform X1 n=1 Tax=Typha latifolia TaxID=4733 RepID=UPI003C2C89AC
MATKSWGSLLLLFLFFSSLFLDSPATASSDSPFMVAHKKVSLSRLKSGAERVSVSIDLYNQGSATAYDVNLNDDSWSQDTFDLVSGSTTKSWERLDAGSTASHFFVLESKVKGIFHGSPASIKFRIPTKASLQEAYSTPVLPLDILADRPPEKKFEWVSHPYTITRTFYFKALCSLLTLTFNLYALTFPFWKIGILFNSKIHRLRGW